ncbi:MAG: hypothetical protein CSA62_06320 [Planctomycetota bacterium]|nr:MAG: hypothetical protein CSA62_06320 [Planctomycetota bacterium]
MEKMIESEGQFVRRHLSQLRVLSRLLEHELELAKGDEVVLDRVLMESALDTLDIFVEDCDQAYDVVARPGMAARKGKVTKDEPQVTRLN